MSEIFIPESKTILKLFDGYVYYQIPSYQRPYSWDSERVEALWDDIYSAFDDSVEEYFLGSIILTRNANNKTLDVVDGQQRMTTLMILFCVLRDLHYKNVADVMKKNMVLGRIKHSETNVDRLKLRTQYQNQNKFEQEIISGINFEIKPTKAIEDDKFLNSAYVFKKKVLCLLEQNQEKFEKFIDYLLERVRVITIECTSQSFAIKLFQVLNTRGMSLTPADLIKSYLMGRLSEEDNRTFEQDWISIENKAKEYGEDLTDLLTYYAYYLLASNPKRSLYEELEKLFSHREPKEIIYEFNKLVGYFSQIDSENSKVIHGLNYLRHNLYWKSILLTAKLEKWSEQEFEKLTRLLRRFYYLYWIADYTTSKTKQSSFNIIQWIKNKKTITDIERSIQKKIEDDEVIYRVIRELNQNNVYEKTWCKPLLTLVEYMQTDESNVSFIDLDKFVHVEHILPQGFNKIKYWTDLYETENANKLVNSIGNLTLLSGKKNVSASNRPFVEKLEVYRGKGIDGITGYRITQKVADIIQKNYEWNAEKINERKELILTDVGKLFAFDPKQEILNDSKKLSETNEEKETISKFKEIYLEIIKELTEKLNTKFDTLISSFSYPIKHSFKCYKPRDGYDTSSYITWNIDGELTFEITVYEDSDTEKKELFFELYAENDSELLKKKFSDSEVISWLDKNNYEPDIDGDYNECYFSKTIFLTEINKQYIIQTAIIEFEQIFQIIKKMLN